MSIDMEWNHWKIHLKRRKLAQKFHNEVLHDLHKEPIIEPANKCIKTMGDTSDKEDVLKVEV